MIFNFRWSQLCDLLIFWRHLILKSTVSAVILALIWKIGKRGKQNWQTNVRLHPSIALAIEVCAKYWIGKSLIDRLALLLTLDGRLYTNVLNCSNVTFCPLVVHNCRTYSVPPEELIAFWKKPANEFEPLTQLPAPWEMFAIEFRDQMCRAIMHLPNVGFRFYVYFITNFNEYLYFNIFCRIRRDRTWLF